ncbi:MAG: SDR family NAD(P)-dependent oxidoreductase, partial [Chloroflexota bacterium]
VQLRRQAKAILSSREIGATLAHIRATGASATYVQADITDKPALEARLKDALPPQPNIAGVIHGAGVLADKRLTEKTPADVDYVYDTKLIGLQNLLEILPVPARIVLFSSAAAYFGNVGQADYALANEVLNKVAYRLAYLYPESQVQALDWGPWDGGMVTPALKQLFTENNIDLIPLEDGARALVSLMQAPSTNQQVVIGAGFIPPPRPLTQKLHTHRIERVIRPDDNPFLADHRINGQRVLPLVHALQWMAQTSEGLYGGYRLTTCTDLRVLKGIIAEEPTSYLLTLKETQKAEGRIVFEASIAPADMPERLNFRAQLELSLAKDAAPPEIAPDLPPGHSMAVYQNNMLFHGPSFQTIQTVHMEGEGGITVSCVRPHVSQEEQGQFLTDTFNPFVADTVLQALTVWVQHQHAVASLPSGIGRWQQVEPLHNIDRFVVTVQPTQTRNYITTAQAAIYHADGRLIARIDDAQHVHHERLRFQSHGT